MKKIPILLLLLYSLTMGLELTSYLNRGFSYVCPQGGISPILPVLEGSVPLCI
jgi:hypothetical protein